MDIVKVIDSTLTNNDVKNDVKNNEKKDEDDDSSYKIKRAINFDDCGAMALPPQKMIKEKLIPKFEEQVVDDKKEIVLYYGLWSKADAMVHCPKCDYGPLSFEGIRKHLVNKHNYATALVRKVSMRAARPPTQ